MPPSEPCNTPSNDRKGWPTTYLTARIRKGSNYQYDTPADGYLISVYQFPVGTAFNLLLTAFVACDLRSFFSTSSTSLQDISSILLLLHRLSLRSHPWSIWLVRRFDVVVDPC